MPPSALNPSLPFDPPKPKRRTSSKFTLSNDSPKSGPNSFELPESPNSNTFKQAIVEIYESLYHFQRERTGQQEAQVIDCISKWYEFNAVFENPFTRANGIESIVNQFSLMSLIPGQIWSELGDVCESEDYNGNRVVVFSHTLHFNLLGSNTNSSPDLTTACTPYLSVPPTPHGGTPNLISRFPSFHSAILAKMSLGPAVTLDHPLDLKRAGSGTTWPITWLISHLSPSRVTENLAKFDLKLSTRLQFNEQARIVTHEDTWGLKECIEFLVPSFFSQAYSLQRWLIGLCGDFLSERYLRSPQSMSINSIHVNQIHSNQSHHHLEGNPNNSLNHHHHPINLISTSLHSPILIGSTCATVNSHHLKPSHLDLNECSRSNSSTSPTSNYDTPQMLLFDAQDPIPRRGCDDHSTIDPTKKSQELWYHKKLLAHQRLQRKDGAGSGTDDDEHAEEVGEEQEEHNTSEESQLMSSLSTSSLPRSSNRHHDQSSGRNQN